MVFSRTITVLLFNGVPSILTTEAVGAVLFGAIIERSELLMPQQLGAGMILAANIC